MSKPVATLIGLYDMTIKLDVAQRLIDFNRAMNPDDQQVQLDMDREQTHVNAKRKLIAKLMVDIPRSN
jgi:hypothetical protein